MIYVRVYQRTYIYDAAYGFFSTFFFSSSRKYHLFGLEIRVGFRYELFRFIFVRFFPPQRNMVLSIRLISRSHGSFFFGGFVAFSFDLCNFFEIGLSIRNFTKIWKLNRGKPM